MVFELLILLLICGYVGEHAAIETEDVGVNFATLVRAETTYTAAETENRLECQHAFPVAVLGLCSIIKLHEEINQFYAEGLRVFLYFRLAIAFDEQVDESVYLMIEIRIVSVVLEGPIM